MAFAGTAAAAGTSSGFTGPLPSGTVTDDTPDSATTTSATSTIADVTFDTTGDVSNVTVDATGGDEGDIAASSIDSVTVSLYDSSNELANNTVNYDNHDQTVEFNGADGNVSGVERIVVEATLSGSASDGEVIDALLTVETNPVGTVDTENTQTVDVDAVGFFSGRVSSDNQDVEDATVIVRNTTTGFEKTTTTNAQGDYEISVPAGSYTVLADAQGFEAASPKDGEVDPGATTSANFVLTRIVNAGEMVVTPSTDSAVADGTSEFEYEIELFDDFDGSPIEDTVEVQVDAPNEGAISGLSDGDTVTTTGGNVTVTATSSEIQTAQFTFTAQSNTSVSETVTAQFVAAEGNLTLVGYVEEYGTNADVEGATVWAAYPGGNQTRAFAEEETGLATTTEADGDYQIADINEDRLGVSGELTADQVLNQLNVYVAASGYNGINGTASDGTVDDFGEVDQFYATNAKVSMDPAGDTADNTTEKVFTVSPKEITPVYDVTVDVTQDGDSVDRIPTQSVAEIEYEVRVKSDTEPDSEFEPVSESDFVTAEEVDVVFNITAEAASGNLLPADADDQVITYGEDAQFESTRTPSTPNNVTINASVVNEDGQEFNASTDVEVFGVGQITGDVVNDQSPADNLPNATVTLIRNPDTPNEEIVRTTTTGPEGSYSFSEVETGFDYRIEAEFDNESGFSDLTKDSAGTTNADVVIVGVEAPEGFSVQDIDPADVTVTQGDIIDVNATVQNLAPEEDTREVEFRVTDENGTEVVSVTRTVTLQPGEDTVRFEDIDTSGLAAGNYTHGVYTDTNSQTATLTIESSGNNGGNSVVDQFDTNGQPGIQPGEAQDAIAALNNDEIGPSEAQAIIAALNS